MASVWYCCGCSFGPHNVDLYDACISCGRRRCSQCVDEKTSLRLSCRQCPESSLYPDPVAIDTPHRYAFGMSKMLPTGLGGLSQARARHPPAPTASQSLLGSGVQLYGQTYMYVCCRCNDGPKVYNVQPQCVVCDHMACEACVYVK